MTQTHMITKTRMTLFKVIFFGGLFLFNNIVFCQEIQTGKKSKLEMFDFESKQIGVLTDTIKNFGILRNPHNDLYTLDQTRVYIFKRVKDDFDPQLHVWYHFDTASVELKAIRYNWGLYNPSFNPSKNKNYLDKLTKKELEFVHKYKTIKEELEKSFGKPFKSKTISDNERSYIENVFWEDSAKIIGLAIKFSRQLKGIPGIGVDGDFEIEVMITYK